jgi:hypothetical protein
MRRLWIILGCISILSLVVGIVAAVRSPWILEARIASDCAADQPSEACIVRMRAMGHIRTAQGSIERGETWYRRAAGQGDASAMFQLGWIYQMRAIDQIKSMALRAGEREMAAAEVFSAQPGDKMKTLRDGEAISISATEAASWYEKAAAKKFAPAMNNLGELYRLGILGDPDPTEAFKWYLRAAVAGNPVGCWNVAMAYASGQGVRRDAAESQKWLAWSGRTSDSPDLAWPTLERTTIFGGAIPSDRLAILRGAAGTGVPVALTMTPVLPDPRIKPFSAVVNGK